MKEAIRTQIEQSMKSSPRPSGLTLLVPLSRPHPLSTTILVDNSVAGRLIL
jgi:hypothetical protein